MSLLPEDPEERAWEIFDIEFWLMVVGVIAFLIGAASVMIHYTMLGEDPFQEIEKWLVSFLSYLA